MLSEICLDWRNDQNSNIINISDDFENSIEIENQRCGTLPPPPPCCDFITMCVCFSFFFILNSKFFGVTYNQCNIICILRYVLAVVAFYWICTDILPYLSPASITEPSSSVLTSISLDDLSSVFNSETHLKSFFAAIFYWVFLKISLGFNCITTICFVPLPLLLVVLPMFVTGAIAPPRRTPLCWISFEY